MAGPFFRQAGGKRELAPAIVKHFPAKWSTYVEPFLGGGAVFFHLWNTCDYFNGRTAILGDADRDLTDLYKAVRDDVMGLECEYGQIWSRAVQSGDAKTVYLEERARWNQGDRTPARHLYLRHQAFNGLWRQNRLGHMNVPWCQKGPRSLGPELLHAMAALKGHEILDWDFRRYEADNDIFIGPGTVIYLDPPYLSTTTSFTQYTAIGWTKDDLEELMTLAQVWHDRDATVVMSHADTALVRDMQQCLWPLAEVHTVKARRSINSDGSGRGPVGEVILVGRVVT